MTRLRLIQCLCLLFIPVLFASCVATSGIGNTTTIAAPDATMAQKKTYAWYQPDPEAEAAYGEGYGPSLHKNLLQAIEEGLEQKGYIKTSVNPDLLVAYDVSVSVPDAMDKPELYGPGFGYSYAYMAGYRYTYSNSQMPGYRAVDLFKKGTLIIDLIEPKGRQLLWRGWTEGAVTKPDAGYGKIKSLVQEILKQLPPVQQK